MNTHLMLDFETLGTSSDSVVLSLGAVFFNRRSILEQREWVFSLQSQIDSGRRIDASTVIWWINQEPGVREVLKKTVSESAVSLYDGFIELQKMCIHHGDQLRVWGNDTGFDTSIAEHIFKSHSLFIPWKHWHHRCYRTIKSLFKIEEGVARIGPKHLALGDATFQASCLFQYLQQHPEYDR